MEDAPTPWPGNGGGRACSAVCATLDTNRCRLSSGCAVAWPISGGLDNLNAVRILCAHGHGDRLLPQIDRRDPQPQGCQEPGKRTNGDRHAPERARVYRHDGGSAVGHSLALCGLLHTCDRDSALAGIGRCTQSASLDPGLLDSGSGRWKDILPNRNYRIARSNWSYHRPGAYYGIANHGHSLSGNVRLLPAPGLLACTPTYRLPLV